MRTITEETTTHTGPIRKVTDAYLAWLGKVEQKRSQEKRQGQKQ